MTSTMRPDEQAAFSEIERSQNRDKNIKKGIKTAVGIGSAALGLGAAKAGSTIYSKIAPFLSEYIPVDLAMKGINKINPALGSFLQKGMKQGLNVKDGLNFIKENMQPKQEEKKESTKEKRNIIEQYSPELNQFINEEVGKGRTPIEAAALAQNDKRFKDVIGKLTKDHKTPWSNIIEGIFGKGQATQPQQQGFLMPQPEIPHSSSAEQDMSRQQQQPQQGQQPGQGQQALMAILQKLQQSRGQ